MSDKINNNADLKDKKKPQKTVEEGKSGAKKSKSSGDSSQSSAKKSVNQKSGKAAKSKKKKTKVLFVCTGNTCRSPMAEHIFKQFLKQKKQLSAFDVKSAGLYAEESSDINPNAVQALLHLGIKAGQQSPRQLTEIMAENSDLIICMTAGHKMSIEGHNNIFSVSEITGASDVPDPYGADLQRYLAVAKYLMYACEDIFRIATKITDK